MEATAYFHTAYRPEELHQMVEGVGFTVDESGTIGGEVIVIDRALRLPLALIGRYGVKLLSPVAVRRLTNAVEFCFFYALRVLGLRNVVRYRAHVGYNSYVLATKNEV
jgi:hypothetical protein